jgi:hypothetical protein
LPGTLPEGPLFKVNEVMQNELVLHSPSTLLQRCSLHGDIVEIKDCEEKLLREGLESRGGVLEALMILADRLLEECGEDELCKNLVNRLKSLYRERIKEVNNSLRELCQSSNSIAKALRRVAMGSPDRAADYLEKALEETYNYILGFKKLRFVIEKIKALKMFSLSVVLATEAGVEERSSLLHTSTDLVLVELEEQLKRLLKIVSDVICCCGYFAYDSMYRTYNALKLYGKGVELAGLMAAIFYELLSLALNKTIIAH